MAYQLLSFTAINVCSSTSHPEASVWLPPGYTLTGGGAWDVWDTGFTGASGNLLTACCPIQASGSSLYTGWYAAGKDHLTPSPAPLVVAAIGIMVLDSNGNPVPISQLVTQSTSAAAAHPTATAEAPSGYLCTGGGAQDNYGSGVGNMLTGSYPTISNGVITGWTATGKDQIDSDPCTITAYAIGISVPNVTLSVSIASATSRPEDHPYAYVAIPDGTTLVAGGANDVYTGEGNLLTSCFPGFATWELGLPSRIWTAEGKDHLKPDPSGTLTVWAISLQVTS